MANRLSSVVNRWETTSTAEMGSAGLSLSVVSSSGLASPAYVVLEEEVPGQYEVVYFDGSFTGTSLVTTSVGNRYLQGSAAGAGLVHPSGSTVRVVPVSQVVTDLNDRISLHSHSGTGIMGAQINHGSLSDLGSDVHTQYLPLDGTRPMSADLDLGNNDIIDVATLTATGLATVGGLVTGVTGINAGGGPVSNVGLVDGIDVTAHGDRHRSGGADPGPIDIQSLSQTNGDNQVNTTFAGGGTLLCTFTFDAPSGWGNYVLYCIGRCTVNPVSGSSDASLFFRIDGVDDMRARIFDSNDETVSVTGVQANCNAGTTVSLRGAKEDNSWNGTSVQIIAIARRTS